jgi:hypothetical protein
VKDLDLLPEASAIEEMLADYAVMREQATQCEAAVGISQASQRH